ncbi:MAG: DUF1501 domain-containing protein [Pirellulales bacterium]
MLNQAGHVHASQHAFGDLHARSREGLVVTSRRSMLKAGLAGMAGLTLPALVQARSGAGQAGRVSPSGKSVILLWMAGGPSHLDMWDPKPHQPIENRGPFGVTQTKLPGIVICEHLPKQAAMLDKFTLIRSVDPRRSNHEPNKVFQTGNLEAEPRINRQGDMYPAVGSVIAKHHGANQPGVPPYATFMKSRSHVAMAGYLGKQYDPFVANDAARLPIYSNVGVDTGQMTDAAAFRLPGGLTHERLYRRLDLVNQLDRLRTGVDPSMESLGAFQQQAVEMLVGGRVQQALDMSREPEAVRARYSSHLWCQQALLARRLVEAGVAFVTLDLSHHTASGTWDTHGDNIPPYGGITKGLGPLLPIFDHLITTLVSDLEERGLLNDVLVLAMGEFGRTPKIGTQASTDGRDHWPYVMSMALAGGGFRHGQVIGASDKDGGQIKERPVTPGDLVATIYHHMSVPLDATYNDLQGRPRFIVENGEVIRELV